MNNQLALRAFENAPNRHSLDLSKVDKKSIVIKFVKKRSIIQISVYAFTYDIGWKIRLFYDGSKLLHVNSKDFVSSISSLDLFDINNQKILILPDGWFPPIILSPSYTSNDLANFLKQLELTNNQKSKHNSKSKSKKARSLTKLKSVSSKSKSRSKTRKVKSI
jgi:hypothetical protein